MPMISFFFLFIIRMFFSDHAPPHFHAQYGEYKAIISILDLKLIEGELPRRALGLILDWAELHQKELLDNWSLAANNEMPNSIKPLE